MCGTTVRIYCELMNQNTTTHQINDIPEELLLEIFKWIPFNDLHTNVKPVCKKWLKVASTTYLHPNTLTLSGTHTRKTVHLLTKYGSTLTVLKFRDTLVSSIVASLNLKCCQNLKILSMKWHWNALGRVRMPISCFNWIIDQCPKLRGIELRECFIYGDVETLVKQIEAKGIREITLVNTYLVVNGIEKLFFLKNMRKFKVFCHFVCERDIQYVENLCRFNSQSLESLGLRIENSLSEKNDVVMKCIADCKRLKKLDLIGQFTVSAAAFRKIAELPNLAHLKIDIHSVPGEELVKLFRLPFSRKLCNLKIVWHRPVTQNELKVLFGCKNLVKLTVGFMNALSDVELISKILIDLIKYLHLRKFKFVSSFSFLDFLPDICFNTIDLFYIKVVQSKGRCKKTVKRKLKTILTIYELVYLLNGDKLEIILRKRIDREREKGWIKF